MFVSIHGRACFCATFVLAAFSVRAPGQDPWADRVVSYDPGSTPVGGFKDPQTALGSPERFTGEGVFPGVVSVFNPPFGTDELVSIGEGGHLTLGFDEPITNDASHPFGVDFLAFGNGGFVDVKWPMGMVGPQPTLFGADEMRVSVSSDGVRFVDLGAFVEGFFPTQGYLDAGPYATSPGSFPTDFTLPVNPAFLLAGFANATLADVLTMYAGSGGGTPIDIGAAGLSAISFVRIDVFDDGNPNTQLNVEIDALAIVPEPSTLALFGFLVLAGALRKKRQ